MSGWRRAGHFSFDPSQNIIVTKNENPAIADWVYYDFYSAKHLPKKVKMSRAF
jgi:hypothetical protein